MLRGGAESGAVGGSGSAEFQVLVQSGEDGLAACLQCTYAANLEAAKTPPLPRRGARAWFCFGRAVGRPGQSVASARGFGALAAN